MHRVPHGEVVNFWVRLDSDQQAAVESFVRGRLADFSVGAIRGRQRRGAFSATADELNSGYLVLADRRRVRLTPQGIRVTGLGFLRGIGSPRPIYRAEYADLESRVPTTALLMWRQGNWTVRLSFKETRRAVLAPGKRSKRPAPAHVVSTSKVPTKDRPRSSSKKVLVIGSGRKRTFSEILEAEDADAIRKKQEELRKIEKRKYRAPRPARLVILSGGGGESNRRRH